MSIRRGLRYGEDDDDQPKQYQKQSTQANRNRTNFQKDMDSLLFGGGPRRKPAAKEPPKDQGSKVPTEPKKNPPQPKQNKSQDEKSNKPKPLPNQPKKDQKPQQPPNKSEPKKDLPEQPRTDRQTDTFEKAYDGISSIRYNKPSYIRKLKKVANDFNFVIQNTQKHVALEVVRPTECIRESITKYNIQEFQDIQFPPDSYSIGPKYRAELVIWKKPNQIYKTPVFGKYIEPNDIEPGTLSSPQFVSTLTCLAEREQNIKRLIENQKLNDNGFYYVRLNINGVWRYFSVDDNLPELDDRPMGVRSYNDSEAELWPSIIEKAYAKAYQGYISFDQNTPREHYLRDLTGSPVKKYQTYDSALITTIQDALAKGWPVLAVPKEKIMSIGLNPNYSLTVLKCNSKGGLQLRNSWGTVSEKQKIPINKQGVFELSSSQLSDFISHILIAETDQGLRTTTIQSKHYGSFYSCFNFSISDRTQGVISVNQFDRRMFSINAHYEYACFRIILEMKNASKDGESVFVNAAFSYHSRNLDLPVNLPSGNYHLYCIGQWSNQPQNYNVTIFAKQIVPINKIYYSNFPNIISEALTEVTLTKGKRSSKGHVDEYILYHEPSNLVLITAKSLVNKPYQFTLNLNQVKFNELTLLNAAYPQDNFLNKNREQLESMKSSYFDNKLWNVNLLPDEKYTWVFSSDADYHLDNFKKWGFK